MSLSALVVMLAGCAVKDTTKVPAAQIPTALEADRDQLVQRYNQQARAVRSLNAAVELKPTAGTAYSGVIEEYREVKGFVLAQAPMHIRVIGQAPVVAKNIFDMTSDGETFRIYIPSKNKFITGPAEFERTTAKPIENLRPQHLLDALFWSELAADATVLFEEYEPPPPIGNKAPQPELSRFYVLTVLRRTPSGPTIDRKIWFDRADLNISRIEILGAAGRLLSDIRYADWQPVADVRYRSKPLLCEPSFRDRRPRSWNAS